MREKNKKLPVVYNGLKTRFSEVGNFALQSDNNVKEKIRFEKFCFFLSFLAPPGVMVLLKAGVLSRARVF